MRIKFLKHLAKFILKYLDLWVLILLTPSFALFFVMYDSPLRTFLCVSTTLIGLVLTLFIVKKFKPIDKERETHESIANEELKKYEIRKLEHTRFITDKNKY